MKDQRLTDEDVRSFVRELADCTTQEEMGPIVQRIWMSGCKAGYEYPNWVTTGTNASSSEAPS